MANPIDALRDWATGLIDSVRKDFQKDIERAKLDAQIAVVQTIILGLSAQLENLRRSRSALN